jgi:transposase, IS30 family
MGRSISTLSEELKRNKVKGAYDAKKADHKAYVRRKESKFQGMKIVAHPELRSFVETYLREDQSPGNLAGRIRKREPQLPSISKDSIYRYLKSPYGRDIEGIRALKRPKRRRKRKKVSSLPDRTFIDDRPRCIDERSRVGDAEADFIVSGKQGHGILLVVVDRKLRTSFLEQILLVTIKQVHQALLQIKKRYPELQSITTDNDILFQKHKELEKLLGVPIYFCHPYHSWEKGTVENTNKYIRKKIPKGSDLSLYSKEFITGVETYLNSRFMDCIESATPLEMLRESRKKLT